MPQSYIKLISPSSFLASTTGSGLGAGAGSGAGSGFGAGAGAGASFFSTGAGADFFAAAASAFFFLAAAFLASAALAIKFKLNIYMCQLYNNEVQSLRLIVEDAITYQLRPSWLQRPLQPLPSWQRRPWLFIMRCAHIK